MHACFVFLLVLTVLARVKVGLGRKRMGGGLTLACAVWGETARFWHSLSFRLGRGMANRQSINAARRRRLGFETLEDRRVLATITVNTLVDENDGIGVGGISLREAVGAAAAGDTINFSVAGTISLLNNAGTPGHIQIGRDLTIQGPGANLLTIKAFDPDPGGTNNSNGRRVFVVSDSNAGSLANVTISGLTLSNGDPVVVDENDGGSAIKNSENLTVRACVISGNYSPNGGAIYSSAGALAVNDCTISNNAASDGAILVSGGSLAIARSRIADNLGTNSGGGVLARGVPVSIVDSTISGNFTDEYGGGIYLYQGSLTMSGTTVSGNAADNNHDGLGSGGGIFNLGGTLSITNSTISGNAAGEGGGGIFSNTIQSVTITSSTITGNVVANTATSYGGGINSANLAVLKNTIVAGNVRGATTRDDVKGMFSSSYSLIGDKRDATVGNSGGSQIGTTAAPIDPKLGTLTNNGGPTLTHTLLSGSPAIDAGDPAATAGQGGVPMFDQRGNSFARVVDFDGVGGARMDIGAVEISSAPTGPALPGDYNLNHLVDAGDYVLWRKTAGGSVSPAYSGADGDGNGVVNGNDYTVWRSGFGNTGAAGGGTAVDGSIAGEEESVATAATSPVTAVTFDSVAMIISIGREDHVITCDPQVAATDEAIEMLAGVERAQAVGNSNPAGNGDHLSGWLADDVSAENAPVDAGIVVAAVESSLCLRRVLSM